tara:strand:+ start:400 stop:6114 length:5715 start_codon:yes stop_codon:yes gene_type:complete
MPAGTWNLGRLRKNVEYTGIKDLGSIEIQDTSTNSDTFFNIVDFPTTLTGGKNLFKIKASADTLVQNSTIHIEVLDSNGNALYYEPINYLEADGTRVIAIYIYPDAPYGRATVYIAGRARVNPENGQILRSSQNVNDRDYLNLPNILWSRTVTVAPNRLNSTEIIFTKKPKLEIREVVQPYLQPVNLTNVATQSAGPCCATIRPKPASIGTSTTTLAGGGIAVSLQGEATSKTPGAYLGTQVSVAPLALALATATVTDKGDSNGDAVSFIINQSPQTVSTTTLITAIDESVFETECPFFTTDMNPGDVITIHNPNIAVQAGADIGAPGLIPKSQANDGIFGSAIAGTHALSGSYNFVISFIYSTTKADVVLLNGFQNAADNNTGGKWKVDLSLQNANGSKGTQTIDTIECTTDYTCSFTLPFVTELTEQSQSYAEIRLGDIEPATGDVYKIKTFYKPGGAFGDFIDAGEIVLEQIEILEDTGSYESGAQFGTNYNRIGFFSSLEDYQTYFTSSQAPFGDAPNQLTETFEPDDLMSGIRLTPAGNYGVDEFGYIKIKEQYRPRLTKDTQYLFTVNSYADMGSTSSDPNVGQKPQIDIYVSGSAGSIQTDVLTLNAYITTPFTTYENSLQGIFADEGQFGTRIGSIQQPVSGSVTPAIFRFNNTRNQSVDLYIVQRNGRGNIANISLKTFNESKFTPNFTRINTRIPTAFLNTPLTFKVQFYDFLGQQAETEALIYPVTFTGENLVIGGDNNLLSGTVYIGNSVGSGIELAGVNSGFIRSTGYAGFKSASRTDQPGGFMIYTGSVLPETPDNYNGVGLELVKDSGSFLRFASDDNVSGEPAGLVVKTPSFFFGGDNNFVSGALGNIEISSSNFHLDKDGSVVMQGQITAEAGGTIGGFAITPNAISSSNDSLILRGLTGQITASNIKAAGGTIAGFTIEGNSLYAGNENGYGGFVIHGGPTLPFFRFGHDADNNIAGHYFSAGNFGLQGLHAGNTIFSLGDGTTVKNQIAGWTFTGASLDGGAMHINKAGFISASTYWQISSSEEPVDPAGFISSSAFKVSADGRITASAGSIGSWTIESDKLSAGTDSDYIALIPGTGIQLGDSTFDDAPFSVTDAGVIQATSGEIAGWTLASDKLTGGAMIIRKDGTIESDGFVSNLAGSGFRLSAVSGGMLEVENARIRGTLSTAVFEKESVNAVGGQLYVANSTTLTGSIENPGGFYSATDTTMSVVNVGGFTGSYENNGEILSLKKISQTGFNTEYILVQSASRNDSSSDTDLSGKIYVVRGYSGSGASGADSGSLGDLASVAQTYTGSQVLVSTGRPGTGYIRLNANPNDPTTPYIDIVERTGSAIYDVSLKARLGDLSGITDTSFSDDVTGFGLYTENGYFKGKIEVASLPKPPPTEDLILYYPLQASFLGSTGINRTADLSGLDNNSRNHANGLVGAIFISGSDSGPTGGALSFDPGVGTAVENRTIQNHMTNGMDMTVTYWAKKEGTIAQRCQWHFSDGGNNEIALFTDHSTVDGRYHFQSNNASEGVLTIDSGSLAVKGIWRHYALVAKHGRKAQLYIDGVKRGSFTGDTDFGSVEDIENFVVGCDVDTNIDTRNDYFTGSMADFKVYKKGLTTSEIESLYNAPTAGVGRTVIDGNRITTGQIRSNNWATDAGSELNLNLGTIKLGGSAAPTFQVDSAGSLTATAGTIAGWTIDADEIKVGTNIGLDSANKQFSINSTTYGNTGIQLDYNGGTPRAFIGKSDGAFLEFDGTDLEISSSNFFLGKDQSAYISASLGNLEISSSGFIVNRDGFVKASSFAETVVTVTAANSSSYMEDIGSDGVRMVFDGSAGGSVTKNIILDVAPYNQAADAIKPIQDVKLPFQDDSVQVEVTIQVNAELVKFDDGEIPGNNNQWAQK